MTQVRKIRTRKLQQTVAALIMAKQLDWADIQHRLILYIVLDAMSPAGYDNTEIVPFFEVVAEEVRLYLPL